MTAQWNFERRRDTCTQFLIGVHVLAKGLAERDTSLEAVRTRMRLSPEEARFASRRLDEEKLLAFEPETGAIRSNSTGIARAEALMAAVRSKAQRFDDVTRALRAGGSPLAVIAAVLRESGEPLACGAPDAEPDVAYRLALVADVVTLERRAEDGSFSAATPAE